jgi:putative GTP pyrophosphokinase
MTTSKAAIDRLGARLRSSAAVDPRDAEAYADYRAGFEPLLREVQRQVGELGVSLLQQTARLKTMESTVAKLQRETIRLAQIQDIAGFRITVETLDDQDDAVRRISGAFPEVKVHDLRDEPRCGYRAVHMIIPSNGGRAVELQVRTELQDAWANVSERIADLWGVEVKYCGGPAAARTALSLESDLVRDLDNDIRELARLHALTKALEPRFGTVAAGAHQAESNALVSEILTRARRLTEALDGRREQVHRLELAFDSLLGGGHIS